MPIQFIIITAPWWGTRPPASNSADPSVAPVSPEGRLGSEAVFQAEPGIGSATQAACALPAQSCDVDGGVSTPPPPHGCAKTVCPQEGI